ncbi:MAG: branched-chain amino acid ABC transporter permease [Rubrivivax sp.]|nr:MAG: branched-chain amino acid ABC transporter permease [Rubrivivax sp.]
MAHTKSWGLLHPSLRAHAEFRQGARDMAAVTPGVMAWGLVTGVAMVKAGLPLSIALLMSLCVFAASAQLAALPLMLAGAPLWVVWVTALCVNLRFVIFSAQMRLHMMSLPLKWRLLAGYLTADITYVMMVQRHGTAPAAGPDSPAPLAYFAGLAAVNWTAWNVASLAGVVFAGAIPTQWGLGFAGTLALVGLLVSLMKDRLTALTAGIAGTAAVAAFALPFKLNIIVAVASAVACGLLMDQVTASGRKLSAQSMRGEP